MLEPDWTELQQGCPLHSAMVTTWPVGLQSHQGPWKQVQACCQRVAYRSAINIVSTIFVAKFKLSGIFILNIRENINKILNEEDAAPNNPADLTTWRLHIRKPFADLIELPMGVPPALKCNFRLNTDLAAELADPKQY